MKKIIFLSLLACSSVSNALIIGWDGNANTASNVNTLATSLGGGSTAVPLVNTTTFNGFNTSDLLSSYDMLVIGWISNSGYNLDWSTVLLPYLNAGGVISWEDPINLSELVLNRPL